MYADSVLSLVVPVVVILLVLITRKVVLSLFIGIVLAAFMLKDSLFESISYIFFSISSVVYSDGEISISSLYVFLFLVLLGILTQIMQSSGGMQAFVIWARNRIKSPQGSEFLAFIAGIVIFIDDYFNALTVGQIARPLNDANHSTRERLAYIIDSTSAPVCILMPISSWGAYILGITGGLIEGESGFGILVSSIWGNYYAWFALLSVFLVIYWQINLSSMRKYQNVGLDNADELKYSTRVGSIWMLIIPIISLIVFVGFFIFYTGYRASNSINPIDMLSNAETGFALFYGGVCSVVIALLVSYKNIKTADYLSIIKDGFMSMLPAILILILAWSIGPVIKNDLQSGVYLANLSKEFLETSTLPANLIIPVILFVISGFIALCTGTSWGTFAIMLPIGASIALANDVNVSLSISAVLAGAVYGDHASPISDTTILSATGAGCSVQSHFITQLPYATTTALISVVSFAVAGLFDSLMLGYVIGMVGIVIVFGVYKKFLSKGLN